MRVFNPDAKLRTAFSNKTVSDSSAEVPSAADLENKLGIQIFEKFGENDVSEAFSLNLKNIIILRAKIIIVFYLSST